MTRNRRYPGARTAVVFAIVGVMWVCGCSSKDKRPFDEVREVDGLIAVAAERSDGTVERVRIVNQEASYIVHDSEKGPDLREWPGRRTIAQGRVYEVEGVYTIVVTDYRLEN